MIKTFAGKGTAACAARLLTLLVPLLFTACGEGEPEQAAACAAPAAAAAGYGPQALAWGACPAYMEAPPGVACATLPAPLDHDDPQGRSIDILLVRYLADPAVRHGRLWFLQGGPGASVAQFVPLLPAYGAQHPQWDYYLLEHRGVGASTRLGCPGLEPGTDACAADLRERWGDDVAHFDSTQAAHDLKLAMAAVADGNPDYLYGDSYGTYLAQRFLGYFPEAVEGVVLDGIVPVGEFPGGERLFDRYDGQFRPVTDAVLAACDADPICGARLREVASDTPAAMQRLYDQLEGGTLCPALADAITREELRYLLAVLSSDWFVRPFVPALLYRALRCSATDAEALQGLFADTGAALDDPDAPDSPVLFETLAISELLGPTSHAEALAFSREAQVSPDFTLELTGIREQTDWPVYVPESRCWPETDVPMLLMNGTLDPQTPADVAQFTAARYSAPDQRLVTLPGAPHLLLLHSYTGTEPDPARTCGAQLLFDFLEQPRGVLDTACTGQLLASDYTGTTPWAEAVAVALFGRPSMWD